MKMKQIMATVLAATMLVGCGSQPADNSQVPTAEESAENESESESESDGDAGADASVDVAGAEIRFLDVNPGATRQDYFERMFAQIEDELGIKVTYESVPMDDAADKIMVMASSNSMPDIITTIPNWVGTFVANDYLVPLTDYVAPIEDELSEAVKLVGVNMQKGIYNDVYSIPDGLFAKAVFVRKDWADEAGIELNYDWDYDDYFETITKLTDVSKNRYGMTFRGVRGAFDPIMAYLQSYTGGDTYDDEGNCLLRTDECLEAYKRYLDTYLNGEAPKDSINWGFTEMCDNFVGGLTGTFYNDPEVAALCIDGMEEGSWTVLPVPHSTKDGKMYNVLNPGYSYTISRDSKNADAAWAVINYLIQPEQNLEYCKLLGVLPVMAAIGDDPYFGEDGPYATFIKIVNDPDVVVPPTYNVGDFNEVQQGPLFEEIQKYLLGEETAEESFNNICDALEGVVKEYLAENPGASVEKPLRIE